MLKVIENKDSEIADLKRQLEYQERFISELNKTDSEDTSNTYDLELVQRFLVVGYISDVLPEIKHKFPNSIFMESKTSNLSGIEVDAVVMLIKWMMQSMFYRVKLIG